MVSSFQIKWIGQTLGPFFMFQVKNKTQNQTKKKTKFLILQDLDLTQGLICVLEGYNLILKFDVQTFGLDRRVNSWIFIFFSYQSQFLHRVFWDNLILRYFKMNSVFLSPVLLAQEEDNTTLSLLLRNSLVWFWVLDTCHNIYMLCLPILSQAEH